MLELFHVHMSHLGWNLFIYFFWVSRLSCTIFHSHILPHQKWFNILIILNSLTCLWSSLPKVICYFWTWICYSLCLLNCFPAFPLPCLLFIFLEHILKQLLKKYCIHSKISDISKWFIVLLADPVSLYTYSFKFRIIIFKYKLLLTSVFILIC
jgi:hypothetical protein